MQKLGELLSRVREGKIRRAGPLTVESFLTVRWLPAMKSAVRETTFEGYSNIVAMRLVPTFGKVPLRKLTAENIQEGYTRLEKHGGKDGSKLSRRSVYHAHRTLYSALAKAVKWELLPANPVAAVTPPKPERVESVNLGVTDVERIFEAFRGTWAYGPVFVSAFTGMRRSEVLGLRWHDIDFDNRIVSVKRAFHRLGSKESVVSEPKSRRGQRRVSLIGLTVEFLREHQHVCQEERDMLGRKLRPADYVFAVYDAEAGGYRPDDPHSLTQIFRRTMKDLELPGARFHDLRHAHASLMLRTGIHPKIVSERLGHSNVSITLDLYSHVRPDLQEQAAEAFEALMKPVARVSKSVSIEAVESRE